jgi:hypothetical protein
LAYLIISIKLEVNIPYFIYGIMEMVSQYYSSDFDAIVIGAGHNGLILCFFLHYVLIRHESALALYLSRG